MSRTVPMTIFLCLIITVCPFLFDYDFLHPFGFASSAQRIISLTTIDYSNFVVLFSNGMVEGYSVNFTQLWNMSLAVLEQFPTSVNLSTTVSGRQTYTVSSLNGSEVTYVRNVSMTVLLLWNSLKIYIYGLNGLVLKHQLSSVSDIVQVGHFSIAVPNICEMLLTTILSIDRIEMESYSLNPYHQLLYTFIDKLTYAVLVSYNCLQSSGRIILTYQWLCTFSSGLIHRIQVIYQCFIPQFIIIYNVKVIELSSSIFAQNLFQERNYTFVQNLTKNMIIYQNGNLLECGYDAELSEELATSAFCFDNLDYINYFDRTVLLFFNGSQYMVNDTLLFANTYNLTTIVLSQNSFAYEYNKNQIYFLKNCSNQVCPTLICSMSNCKYCTIQSDICNICQQGYRKTYNHSCAINPCHQPNCILCNFTGNCLLCVTGFILNSSSNSCELISNCLVYQTLNVTTNICSNNVCNDPNCQYCYTNQTCFKCKIGWRTTPTFFAFCHKNICNDTNCNICDQTDICLSCLPTYSLSNTVCTQLSLSSINYAFSCAYFTNTESISLCHQTISPSLQSTIIATKSALTLPYLNQLVSSFGPMIQFNNDYWYYLYHNRNTTNLIYTTIFSQLLLAINNGKMIPFFINQTFVDEIVMSMIDKVFVSDYTKYTNQIVMVIDQRPTQFVSNIQSMVVWNYTGVLLMFMVFKIIHCCLFRKIENKINSKEKELFDKELAKAAKSCFGKVTFFFRQNSFTEILLISFIEANCIFISFYCALQLKLVFFFNFFDKLICLFCIYFCFICLLSSLSFYLLFYGLKPRKGKNFIEYKINVKNAYFSQAVHKFIRNFIFGFIQGLFIDNSIVLLSSLSCLKGFLCLLCLINRQVYESRIMHLFIFLYFLFSCTYDSFLLWTFLYHRNEPIIDSDTNNVLTIIEISSILGLIATVLLQIVYNIIVIAIQFFRIVYNRLIKKIYKQQETNTKKSIKFVVVDEQMRQADTHEVTTMRKKFDQRLKTHRETTNNKFRNQIIPL